MKVSDQEHKKTGKLDKKEQETNKQENAVVRFRSADADCTINATEENKHSSICGLTKKRTLTASINSFDATKHSASPTLQVCFGTILYGKIRQRWNEFSKVNQQKCNSIFIAVLDIDISMIWRRQPANTDTVALLLLLLHAIDCWIIVLLFYSYTNAGRIIVG